MGKKKRLKRQDWVTLFLGGVLFVFMGIFIGVFIYSRFHPEEALPKVEKVEEGPPVFVSSESGTPERIDSSLVLESIDTAKTGFSHWRGDRVVIFFFSAVCPHCRKAFPIVQVLADSLEKDGIQTIALAVGGNSHVAILNFAKAQHSHLPLYHDEERRFGERYGSRTVPLIVLVDPNGAYIKLPGFSEATPGRIHTGLDMMAASQNKKDSVGG